MPGLSSYQAVAEPDEIRSLTRLATRLKGRTFLHVNSTAAGGGVAEILHRLIALFLDVGVEARWAVIEGTQPFFEATKLMHNGLQGQEVHISPRQWTVHRDVNDDNATRLSLEGDLVLIHDPQPAPLIRHRTGGRWV